MGLFAVGRVPYRPIGKSHYTPAPWDVVGDLDYLPAVMSDTAMRKGLQKAMEPVRGYTPIQKARMKHFLSSRMRPIWFGDLVKSRPDVVADLNLKKSAGWPFYYQCDDKEDCLAKFSIEVWDLVDRVLRGEYVPMYFSATLKDELRTKDRVAEEKTRVFNASGIVHLICSKILFSRQNEAIVNTRGMHPSTLGISVPGPEFVTAMLNLKRNCEEGDVSGCDLRLNLDCAEIVRDVRSEHLPAEFREAVCLLYDATYAGHSITEGVIYRLLHNKSGTENTITDTFLILWMQLWEAINTMRPDLDFDEAVRLLINGDDLATGIDAEGFGLKQISEYLAQYGTILEIVHSEKGGPEDITFLSNSLRWRFVPKYGDILVAAGNKAKLVASENFVKSSPELTFEESCLVHLLGLRVCLWPFAFEFEDIEDRINNYLKDLESHGLLSDRIRSFLTARISEEQILSLHIRSEDGLVLFPASTCEEARKLLSLISCYTDVLEDLMSNQQKKPTAAERAAQSARDKAKAQAIARGPNSNGTKSKANKPSGAPVVDKVHPQKDSSMVVGAGGIATEEKFSMQETAFVHPRHGPGVRLRGRELIQLIPGYNPALSTGSVLVNWDVSPANLLGTRAAALAALYEKYRFKIMQFEWSPECGSSVAGKLMLSYDPDCLDATPPASVAGLKALSSFAGSKDTTVWKPCAIRFVEKEDQLLFTNEVPNTDARLIYQGQFYLANGGATPLGTLITGAVYFAFELEFYKPAYEQIAASNDVAFNLSSTTLRSVYPTAKKLFNAAQDAGVTGLTQKTAGGLQKLVDVAGNVFYRTPPGTYRINLSTQETGAPPAVGTLSNLQAPTLTAAIPTNAPAGAQAPTVTALSQPVTSFPANSIDPVFGGAIQAITSGDYLLSAPSGADVWGSLGGVSNWAASSGNAVVGWEFDRLFGAQAVST